MCLYLYVIQEAEENKGATSWPEYYIDQLRSMAAVSNNSFLTCCFPKITFFFLY